MEVQRPRRRLRRRSAKIEDLPGEDETGSRGHIQRQGILRGAVSAVCGAVYAEGRCAQGVEVDG